MRGFNLDELKRHKQEVAMKDDYRNFHGDDRINHMLKEFSHALDSELLEKNLQAVLTEQIALFQNTGVWIEFDFYQASIYINISGGRDVVQYLTSAAYHADFIIRDDIITKGKDYYNPKYKKENMRRCTTIANKFLGVFCDWLKSLGLSISVPTNLDYNETSGHIEVRIPIRI